MEIFWAGHFGKSFEFIRNTDISTGNWPVVSETAYVWTIGTLAAITFIIGIVRIVLRRKINGRLDLDDALFSFALCCSAVSAIFNVYCASYFFVEAELNIGSVTFADFDEVVPAIVQYLQILNSVSAVEWIAIYSVKLCYLMFFNKLTERLEGLRIWWWFVLCFTIPCLIVSCLIGLYLCHDFGPDILLQCTIPSMNLKGGTWNRVSGSLDIATDLMIISIPIILISKVRIDTRRKIVIGTILSLSAAMIGTALIRLFPPTIHILTIDGPWYFFWVAFESSIAILMVSITSFKSIYGGQKRSTSPDKSPHVPTFGSPLIKIKQSLDSAGSKMGKFFLWSPTSSHADMSIVQSDTEELSPMSTQKRIQAGRYFAWETPKHHTMNLDSVIDMEKGYSYHTTTTTNNNNNSAAPPQIHVQNQININVSPRSDSGSASAASDRSDLVSLPPSSKNFSPMSTLNPSVSPLSTLTSSRQDRNRTRDSRSSWNVVGGRY